jgi:hypothetical protein
MRRFAVVLVDGVIGVALFKHESDTPNEVVVILYDTYANLVARGVIPRSPRWRSPFPGGFVPDPPGRG